MISKHVGLMILATWLWGAFSHANCGSGNWGTGYCQGVQRCPYNVRNGQGAFDISDEVKEAKEELKTREKELAAKKIERDKAKSRAKSAESMLGLFLKTEAVTTIRTHFTAGSRCIEYTSNNSKAQVGLTNEPYTREQWQKICKACAAEARDKTNGDCPDTGDGCALKDLTTDACSFKEARKSTLAVDMTRCHTSLKDLSDNINASIKLGLEFDALEIAVKIAKENLKLVKAEDKEKRDAARKEAAEEARAEGRMEGGICLECLGYNYAPERSGWETGIPLIAAGIGASVGVYGSQKSYQTHMANQGRSSQNNFSDYLPGFLSIAGGLYSGLSGGTAQGSFGCAQGLYGNGNSFGGPHFQGNGNMWDYPAAYYDNPYASLYNQGNAPWTVGPNGSLQAGGQFGLGNGLQLGGQSGLNLNAQLGLGGLNAQAGLVNPLANLLGNLGGGARIGINGQLGSPYGLGQANLGGAQYQQQMIEAQIRQSQQQMQQLEIQQARAQEEAQRRQIALQAVIQGKQAEAELQGQIVAIQQSMRTLALSNQQSMASLEAGGYAGAGGYGSGGLGVNISLGAGGYAGGAGGGYAGGAGGYAGGAGGYAGGAGGYAGAYGAGFGGQLGGGYNTGFGGISGGQSMNWPSDNRFSSGPFSTRPLPQTFQGGQTSGGR